MPSGCSPSHFFLPVMTSCHQQYLCILQFTGQIAISNCLPPPPLFSTCYIPLCFVEVRMLMCFVWGSLALQSLYITSTSFLELLHPPNLNTHTHTCARTHTRIHTQTHTHTHTQTHTHVHAHTHTHIQARTHAHTHTHDQRKYIY